MSPAEWSGDRISDAFSRINQRMTVVEDELRAIRAIPVEIAKLALKADQHMTDVSACHDAVRTLRNDLVGELDDLRNELKADRRSMRVAMVGAFASIFAAGIAGLIALVPH